MPDTDATPEATRLDRPRYPRPEPPAVARCRAVVTQTAMRLQLFRRDRQRMLAQLAGVDAAIAREEDRLERETMEMAAAAVNAAF